MTSVQPYNVLFICTDQQRADHAGFMGNSVLRTPNLDALAARSRVFDNAWVSNPVCMPNRCSIMTGRMPTAHGVVFNDRSLDWGANTFVRRFRSAGYRTGLIGKSHLQHGMSRNAVTAFRGEGVQQAAWPAHWDVLEDFETWLDPAYPQPKDFYGFDHVEFAIDHGARASGHHLRWAIEKGGRQSELLVDYVPDAPGQQRSAHWWQIYQPPYDESLHSTQFVAERTTRFIETATREAKPWLAFCSFPDPHHPMTPPGRWFYRHRPEDMQLPDNRHDTLADAPAHLRVFQKLHPRQQRNWVAPCGYGSDDLLREAIAATYGMLEMIDDRIGQVLACVERLDQTRRTIVVFTSDHGDMMGEHGLFLKGFMHYRGTLQVPLTIAAPDVVGGRTEALASSIDLGPTLMDLCGVRDYDGVQGVSLAPVLRDPQTEVRAAVLIEDDLASIAARLTGIPAKTRTLVTRTHRYTRNSKGEEQLFDLREDRAELYDRKLRDPVARAALVELLTDALIAADDSARGAPVR